MRYYISLGSNIEPRAERLRMAIDALAEYGEVATQSNVYETEALGPAVDGKLQAWHLNQVIAFESALEPEALLDILQTIEQQTGRPKDRQKWSPRELDLDILLCDEAVQTNRLTIPHPEIQNRNFILVPLAEIAGEQIHPTLQVSINALQQASTDPLQVKLYTQHTDHE